MKQQPYEFLNNKNKSRYKRKELKYKPKAKD